MFFDRRCPGCRRRHGRSGARVICAGCRDELNRRRSPRHDGGEEWGLDSLSVLFDYDPLVADLILAGKNGGRRDVLQLLGRWLGVQVDMLVADGGAGGDDLVVDAVTWVPASTARRRRRGYDQGELLAAAVADELGVPLRRVLGRTGNHAQAGRGRTARLAGPELRGVGPAPVRVLLIDDVMTTGASLGAAVSVLSNIGSMSIHGAVVARAPVG